MSVITIIEHLLHGSCHARLYINLVRLHSAGYLFRQIMPTLQTRGLETQRGKSNSRTVEDPQELLLKSETPRPYSRDSNSAVGERAFITHTPVIL